MTVSPYVGKSVMFVVPRRKAIPQECIGQTAVGEIVKDLSKSIDNKKIVVRVNLCGKNYDITLRPKGHDDITG